MTTNADLQKIREAAVPRGVSNMLPVFTERASNAELWDVEGKRYIDFAGGIAVLNTGHLNPTVKAAVAAQLERFSHTCFQVTQYESYVRLAERLNKLAPGPTPKKTMFLTTGAEAVENAVKIARSYTKRSAVIAFSGAFHGRTMLTMGLTGKVAPYKLSFGPMPAEVFHAPFPCEYLGVSQAQSLAASTRCSRRTSIPRASPPSSSSRCRAKAASTRCRSSSCAHCARSATSTASC